MTSHTRAMPAWYNMPVDLSKDNAWHVYRQAPLIIRHLQCTFGLKS
jgi:hypothetical protein